MAGPFTKKTIDFLKTAREQKDPKWLDRHKKEHQELVVAPMRETAMYLLKHLGRKPEARGYKFPVRGFGRLRRAKHKVEPGQTAFRHWLHMQASRPSKSLFDENPSLYFYVSTEEAFAGGGLYEPSSRQIKKLREAIANDAKPFDQVLKSKAFKAEFPDGLETDKILKTFPRLYPQDHKRIEWLRLQAYYVKREFSRKELYSSEFPALLTESWKQALRFNEVLYEALSNEGQIFAPSDAPEVVSDDDLDQERTTSADLWDDRL